MSWLSDLFKEETLEDYVHRTWEEDNGQEIPIFGDHSPTEEWMNVGDKTVDQSWETVNQLLALNEIRNYHELAYLDSLKKESGGPYVKFVLDPEEDSYGSFERTWDTPDSLRIYMNHLKNAEGKFDRHMLKQILVSEAGGHGAEDTKGGTLDSINPYADSLGTIMAQDKLDIPTNTYAEGSRYPITIGSVQPWLNDAGEEVRRDTVDVVQYYDKELKDWVDYTEDTKRGDTTEEFWTHGVLQKPYEERWDQAVLLDAMNNNPELFGIKPRVSTLEWDMSKKPRMVHP